MNEIIKTRAGYEVVQVDEMTNWKCYEFITTKEAERLRNDPRFLDLGVWRHFHVGKGNYDEGSCVEGNLLWERLNTEFE